MQTPSPSVIPSRFFMNAVLNHKSRCNKQHKMHIKSNNASASAQARPYDDLHRYDVESGKEEKKGTLGRKSLNFNPPANVPGEDFKFPCFHQFFKKRTEKQRSIRDMWDSLETCERSISGTLLPSLRRIRMCQVSVQLSRFLNLISMWFEL